MADYRDYLKAKSLRAPVQPIVPARQPGEPVHIERTNPAPGHVVLGNATRPSYRVPLRDLAGVA